MKVPVYDLERQVTGEVELPKVFQTPVRFDVIKRAVVALQSRRFQPQGRDPMAGKRTTAESWGTGHGIARVPRLRGSRRAAFAIGTVGGRRGFPPLSNKKIVKRINKKEKRLAIRSGIAATAVRELVEKRGHRFQADTLPLVVSDDLSTLTKTQQVAEFLVKMSLWEDVERANRKTIRAGRGKTRGRKYKKGRGPLIVVDQDRGISQAARNLPGVEVTDVESLNAEMLAPGAHPGRLVVWTESALKKLDEVWVR